MDADDLAIGEQSRQDIQRDAVGRIVEGRDEDEPLAM